MKEIKIAPSVTLPALNTDIPEQEYPFLTFVLEFMLMNPRMREDNALEALFALEEVLSSNKDKEIKDFTLEDAHWEICKNAAKAEIDERMSQTAKVPLPVVWAMKILRHYHAFAKAETVKPAN